MTAWLAGQAWPSIRHHALGAMDRSYAHPCGFVVIRSDLAPLAGWSIRIHLWPPAGRAPYVGERGSEIHSHGWDLVTRTVVGAVDHSIYSVGPCTPDVGDVWYEHVVDSSYLTGLSVLRRRPQPLRADLVRREVLSAGDPPTYIDQSTFHRMDPLDGAPHWSATLVATADRGTTPSSVLVRPGRADVIRDERRPVPYVAAHLRHVDAAHAAGGGPTG